VAAALAGVIGWKEQDLLQASGSEFHSLRYMGTGQSFSALQFGSHGSGDGEKHTDDYESVGDVRCVFVSSLRVQHRRRCCNS
jgi:hypothetical protein